MTRSYVILDCHNMKLLFDTVLITSQLSLGSPTRQRYADEEARGGILEPSGAVNILWKDQQINDMMHRSDPVLQSRGLDY